MVFPGEDMEVAGNQYLTQFVATSYFGSQKLVRFHKWANCTSSTKPEQSFDVPLSAMPADGGQAKRAIALADNGLIAAVVTVMPDAYSMNARAYWFPNGDLSEKPMTYDSPNQTSALDVELSADGSVLAYVAGTRVVVLDTTTAAVRLDYSYGFSDDAMCLSGDGSLLGHGFQSFYLIKWDPSTSTYKLLWTTAKSGFYVANCALSADSSTMVVTYMSANYKTNYWEVYDVRGTTKTMLWSYTTTPSTATGQDIPYYVSIAPDGSVFAVASWGDTQATNPQIQLFTSTTPTPFFTQKTPGSMFALDLSKDKTTGEVYVVAGGKHVHANVMGYGGDLFAIAATPKA
eukprot:TRINITY_DN4101_c0_g1_i8.p1 TRINITY_DN4101_c0_g1~~TRINITY_DN4101_c0_g1_i8.p1  ORF type:complete len:345 (-),score=91.26 TRINITY_DN4101_c0_g1_i8:164-1198(-)